jgi:hypothetical protein
MLRIGICCLLALVAGNTVAATMLEIKSAEGLTKVYKDGSRSRMESGDSYMVIDSKAGTLYVVMPRERRAIDMSTALKTPASSSGKPVSIDFKKKSAGPRIAGYKTLNYDYIAEGKHCGSLLASADALEDAGVEDTFEMMERMASRADALMAAFSNNPDPCERADIQFARHLKKIGIPMRVKSANGKLVSEIVRIEKNAKLPPNAFTVPTGYQMQDAGQMMQQIPNMQKMMEQMPPEALERLQRMQQR